MTGISRVVLISFLCVVSCSKDTTPSWTSWTVNDAPVFTGQYPLVGDPSVIHEGGLYRMFYTGFDPSRIPQGPEINQATSTDGLTWTNVDSGDDQEKGRMLYTNSNDWSNAHETSFVIHSNNTYQLYFAGYEDSGSGFFGADSVSFGRATSSDGLSFTMEPMDPILTVSRNGFDRNSVSSPSIISYGDSLLMIYAGFCYTACGSTVKTSLLAATSIDGIHWNKHSKPIIDPAAVSWGTNGIAEAEIVKGPDGLYYLFMSSVNEPHVIGEAVASSPYGPWDINQQPIILANKTFSTDGAVAPSVLIENGKVRMWYHGSTGSALAIGYAETSWPLRK